MASLIRSLVFCFSCYLFVFAASSAPQAFRRDPGHPQWHHGAFHDVEDSVRADVRRMLHTRAEAYLDPSFVDLFLFLGISISSFY